MRIGRVEFGFTRMMDGSIAPAVKPNVMRGPCECTIIEFAWFYFTVLGNECYHNDQKED